MAPLTLLFRIAVTLNYLSIVEVLTLAQPARHFLYQVVEKPFKCDRRDKILVDNVTADGGCQLNMGKREPQVKNCLH